MFTHPFFKPQVRAIWAALLLATAAPAWADNTAQFEQAMAAYNAGNYKQTFYLLQPLAQQGDAMAQNNLGAMYTTVKAWYRVINKQWRGIKKRLIKEVLLPNSIWV